MPIPINEIQMHRYHVMFLLSSTSLFHPPLFVLDIFPLGKPSPRASNRSNSLKIPTAAELSRCHPVALSHAPETAGDRIRIYVPQTCNSCSGKIRIWSICTALGLPRAQRQQHANPTTGSLPFQPATPARRPRYKGCIEHEEAPQNDS